MHTFPIRYQEHNHKSWIAAIPGIPSDSKDIIPLITAPSTCTSWERLAFVTRNLVLSTGATWEVIETTWMSTMLSWAAPGGETAWIFGTMKGCWMTQSRWKMVNHVEVMNGPRFFHTLPFLPGWSWELPEDGSLGILTVAGNEVKSTVECLEWVGGCVLQAGALQDLAKWCTCSVYSVDLDTVITRKDIKQMSIDFLVWCCGNLSGNLYHIHLHTMQW